MSSANLMKSVDHASVIRKGLLIVKKHVKSNKSVITLEDADKQTFLHVAAAEADLETLEWLMKHVKLPDLKKRDRTGWTPLHAAAYAGRLDVYALLLKKGASPNSQNAHLTSPFAYLIRHGPVGNTQLSSEFSQLLDLNIERGADIDSQNTNSETPLHYTTERGMFELTKWLLTKGANLNIPNSVGETPLHKAVVCRIPELALDMVQLLVEHGADVSVCGLTGSALALATMQHGSNNDNLIDYLKSKKKAQSKSNGGNSKDYKVRISNTASFGTSYDNIDLPTLLGLRAQSSGPTTFAPSQKPIPEDIVEFNEGFVFETGTELKLKDDLADLRIDDDNMIFEYKDNDDNDSVVNILGFYKALSSKKSSNSSSSSSNTSSNSKDSAPASPNSARGESSTKRDSASNMGKMSPTEQIRYIFCITILKTPENGKLRAVIRTQTGDHRFYIPASALNISMPSAKDKNSSNQNNKQLPKDLLKELQKEIPELDLKNVSKSIIVDNPLLQTELVDFEKSKSVQASRMKIGILYAKAGQKSEEEIFGNEHGSPEFESFLRLLGEVIQLEGWEKFKGDLDVKNNRTGTQSVFTTFRKTDIMFHVSTYLPHSNSDEQQIAKKRCIGNDLTTIIYLEEGAIFKPPTVSGDFLHIFAAVQPALTKEGKPGFKVAFSSRDGVPAYGPVVPKPAIFPSEGGYFRDFLLTKLLNGERASLHSPFLISKMIKTRQMFLESLVQKFAPTLEE